MDLSQIKPPPKPPSGPIVDSFTSLKSKIASLFEGFPQYLIDILVFAPIGLILGFLFRTFGRFLLISILVVGAIFILGQYFNLITVHQNQLHSFVGLNPTYSIRDLFAFLINWSQEHVTACITLIISFTIGWKLGS